MLGLTITVGLLSVCIYLIYKSWNSSKVYWKSRGVEYNGNVSMGSLIFSKRTIGEWDLNSYGDLKKKGLKFAGGSEFSSPILYVIDLDFIKKICIKDFDHFINRREIKMGFRGATKTMLTAHDGQKWKNIRSTLTPAFTSGKIRRMFDVFDTVGTQFTDYLKNKEGVIDMKDYIGAYIMNVIAVVVFGLNPDFSDKPSEFISISRKLLSPSAFRIAKFIFGLQFPKIASFLKIRFFEKEFDDFFSGVIRRAIKHRQDNPDIKWNDFLELLLETRAGKLEVEKDENSPPVKGKVAMDDDMIIGNSILFLFTGFDTTESTLLWAAFELARNPDIQERLYKEIKAVYNKDGKLTYEALNSMSYLDNFVSEVLRCYPAGPRTERRAENNYKIEGEDITIEKGTLIVLPIYSIHRDSDYWEEPFKFNPDRFSPENKEGRHPYAYMPFGFGPRNCIGMRFALQQVKVAIVHLLKSFNLTTTEESNMNLKVGKMTIKPEGPVKIKIQSRDS